mgnify:FL=1
MKSLVTAPLMLMALCGPVITSLAQESNQDSTHRCLVQMTNYDGEGAYVIVSLMDSSDQYLETLYVIGDDPEWYYEIEEWWSYFGREVRDIDGITGPTLSGGERSIIEFKIPKHAFDGNHKLRFETAVEDQAYYPSEIEVPVDSLTTVKLEGTGYIRYARFIQPR